MRSSRGHAEDECINSLRKHQYERKEEEER